MFATFFGNCLVVGLLVASLTTNYWVHSSASKRHSNVTSREATGHLNFGLFSGYKELDVGFGTRPDTIDGMFYLQYTMLRPSERDGIENQILISMKITENAFWK